MSDVIEGEGVDEAVESDSGVESVEVRGRGEGEKMVPVGEAIRYRKRAQAAEQEVEALKGRLQDTSVELEQAKQAIEEQERRERINQLLAEADAVDLDVARLLTEAAVEMMEEPDIQGVVEDLRRHKPYLFKKGQLDGGMMPARLRERVDYQAEEAAERAAQSGNRRDLLRYLRLRRGA